MSQTAQQYLLARLHECGHHLLTESDHVALSEIGMHSFIVSRLFSKKFRKWKLDPACIDRTNTAIATKIKSNLPIKIVFPQGGYKLWRLPSSPTADWAEFFVVAHLLEYIAPIAAAYKPGVEMTFFLHTLLMELHDNLTTDEIKQYVKSLQKILDLFQVHCPKNVKLSILLDTDIYTRTEGIEALETGKAMAAKDYASWPAEQQVRYRKMSELNIKWNGRERWDLLDEAAKSEKIYQAALYETSGSYNLPKVTQIVKSPDNVLVFTKPTKDFIGIGSTKTSVAKYWVGYGVLETDGERFYERVLTPTQWEHCKKTEYHDEKVVMLDLPNFDQVHIFPRLDFSKC